MSPDRHALPILQDTRSHSPNRKECPVSRFGTKIVIEITDEAWDGLAQLARTERRNPRDTAALIVEAGIEAARAGGRIMRQATMFEEPAAPIPAHPADADTPPAQERPAPDPTPAATPHRAPHESHGSARVRAG